MENFPSNSDKTAKDASTKKNTQRVTINEVTRRRKPLSKKVREAFGGDDSRTVMDYVVTSVLIPAVKDTLVDAITQGLERFIFGEARSAYRRTATRRGPVGSVGPGYISYNRYGSPTRPADENQPTISRRARQTHDFDELLIATRAEAEEVLTRLQDLISKYDIATVSDLYDLVGLTGEYTDNRWGWANLDVADISRARDGYLLDLPRPEPLNNER